LLLVVVVVVVIVTHVVVALNIFLEHLLIFQVEYEMWELNTWQSHYKLSICHFPREIQGSMLLTKIGEKKLKTKQAFLF